VLCGSSPQPKSEEKRMEILRAYLKACDIKEEKTSSQHQVIKERCDEPTNTQEAQRVKLCDNFT
jgi:hypothetical protein